MNIEHQNDFNVYTKNRAPLGTEDVRDMKGTGSATQSQGSLSLSSSFLDGIKASPVRQILSTKVENTGGISERKKDEAARKVDEKVRNSQSGLEIIKDTLGETTENSIREEGKTLEQMSPDELAKAVLRIRKENVEKQKMQEEIKESRDEQEQQVKEAALVSKTSGEKGAVVAQMLKEADLPATEEAVKRVLTALDMAEKGKNITEDTMNQLLQAEKRPTIEALYQAGYTPDTAGKQGQQPAVDEGVFEALKPQLDRMVKESGLIPESGYSKDESLLLESGSGEAASLNPAGQARYDELMEAAKWLLANELPVTEENLWQMDRMEQMKSLSDTDILEEIIYSLGNGVKPEKTDLSVTIGQARKSVSSFLDQLGKKDVAQISERRKIEEIRIHMTVQSGYFLMKQGIVLDIGNMERVVEGLKALEESYYKDLLQETGAEGTNAETGLLRDTVQCVEDLKHAPADLLALTCVNRFSMTLTSLHAECGATVDSAGNLTEVTYSVHVSQMTASVRYETMQTQVRNDLGDSLQKAFQNVDELLDEIGMEKTQANERAVRILGRNHMEITQENVNAVKAYDKQMNELFDHFHPAVAAKMIKEGINPLDTPIYELNRQIDRMREEMGIQDEEKYSSYLYRLEQQNQISEEERSAYIGLFRLLHNVKQGENAAVGQLLETGQQMTLSNLLTAVRNRKAQGFDRKLDTDFQGLSSLTYETSSITAQLNRVYSGQGAAGENGTAGGNSEADVKSGTGGTDAKEQELRYTTDAFVGGITTQEEVQNQNAAENQELPEYYHQLLEDLLAGLDPKKVSELLSQKEDVMSMTLEKFAEKACMDGGETVAEKNASWTFYEAGGQAESQAFRGTGRQAGTQAFGGITGQNDMQKLKGTDQQEATDSAEATEETTWVRETAEQLLSKSGEELRFLESLEQPVTMENLYSCMELWKGNNSFYQKLFSGKLPEAETKELSSLADDMLEQMDEEESFDRSVQNFTDFAEEKLEEQYSADGITSIDVRVLSRMNHTIQLVSRLARERHYEIPMVLEEEIVNVSLTILPAAKESGKVHISIADQMEAELVTGKDTLRGYLMCEDSELAAAMKENSESLISAFQKLGYEQASITIGTLGEDRTRFIGASEGGQTETKQLYQLAKQMIQFVRERM